MQTPLSLILFVTNVSFVKNFQTFPQVPITKNLHFLLSSILGVPSESYILYAKIVCFMNLGTSSFYGGLNTSSKLKYQ